MTASTLLVALSLISQTPPGGAGKRVPPPLPTPTLPPVPSVQELPPPNAGLPAPNPAPPTAAPKPVVVRYVFLRHYDRNGDGRLDPSELPRKMVKQFAKSDANGDGFIDANEALFDRHTLGRTARRMEDLEIDREGKLYVRGSRPGEEGPSAGQIVVGVLQRTDRNGDGVIQGHEIGETIRMDVLPLARDALDKVIDGGAPPPSSPPIGDVPPVDPALQPLPASNLAPPPAPKSVAPPPPTASKRAAGKGGNELPTAEETIANLDKDGDGQLDQNEAVDQLAKNFKMLDKNKDGRLSREEIDRGMRLARMFGIKPLRPPSDYAKEPPANPPSPSK